MDRRGVAGGTAGQKVRCRRLTNLLQATCLWLCRSEVKRVSGDKWSETERKTEMKSETKQSACQQCMPSSAMQHSTSDCLPTQDLPDALHPPRPSVQRSSPRVIIFCFNKI